MKKNFKSGTKLLLSERNHNFTENIAEDDRHLLVQGTFVTPLYQMQIKFEELKAFRPSIKLFLNGN